MTTIEILSRLRQLNVTVRLDGDRLRVEAPKSVMSEDLLAELSRRKGEVISFLRSSAEIGNGENELGIRRAPRGVVAVIGSAAAVMVLGPTFS
jgi:hypothetical protein